MLELKRIYKNYYVSDKPFPALKDINLTFPNKGFISILGPSGCGKTTLLNLIGGLDQYTSGDLIINNKSTKKFTDRDWDAYRNKRVGFVFQNYNLVTHLTVLGNVELSMTLTGMSKRERQKKAAAALKRVGLKETLKKKPNQLSGGQMQRVAIARSLVNNPEIVLADEPTGALDSATSVQVMEILKEVAKDRLVIMVTHNDELAKKYSTRIIRLKDGRVISDTHPLHERTKTEAEKLEPEKNKHTHMSFFTALGSSARSLLTKRGRTAMTAVAASFGIIGVALVLAMSNGFQGYVNRVEAETASSVPITISPFVTTQVQPIDLPDPWPSEQEIKPYEENITQLVVIHRNRLTKEYAEYTKGLLDEKHKYASSVLENHEYLDFNIFTQRENGKVIKINQFKPAGAGGSILSGVTNLPSTIFHELYGGKEYIESLYDVVAGEYPNEHISDNNTVDVCLVCDRYNRIPISTLNALGITDKDKVDEGDVIKFNDIIDSGDKCSYKAYGPQTILNFLEKKGLHQTITIPADNCSDFIKETQISPSLDPLPIPHFEAATKDKKIEIYGNIGDESDPKAFEARKELYTAPDNVYNPIKIRISGIIRPKKDTLINLMPGSICYPSALKEHYVNDLAQEYKAINGKAKENYYIKKFATEDVIDDSELLHGWQKATINLLEGVNYAYQGADTSRLTQLLDKDDYFKFYSLFADVYDIASVTTPELLDKYASSSFSNAYSRSNYRFASEFDGSITFNPFSVPGVGQTFLPVPDTYEQFQDLVTYCSGYSTITSILIFPKSLSDKDRIFEYLDAYNSGKEDAEQVIYADLAGNLTSALGTMIEVISVVLIVFSSVSLLVSCVMTGVITYTSVLERTKEIGILRAIGARKKDVGRLFEAESVIIGGIAGLAGVLFTFIVEWPISLIINSRFPEQHIGMICNLHPLHALGLVAISILLTFISGFIPARHAAKKDPVVALRSE